ncbi:MAG TPA: (2Fe-2S)-binding protein [Rhodospirillaceae bacterium]|nr:(2Fe-2S)-binding protein [Rhodospirillaceae bacterium]HAT36732.1 (2Fe-2S)-binding protein [Rhodospirillaceae bacterium]|tara:strand:+ start:566 stop:1057 length:492 start_codon:yes stop_codon:yes gene_type:complete
MGEAIRKNISITVNGEARNAAVPPRMTLLDFLRDELDLTGTHAGCEHGVCGACSVIHDSVPVRSCLMYAVQADGHEVVTVEGLAKSDGTLSVLQDCFWETHAMQCGYCTPGMLMAGHALLQENTEPSEDDIVEAIGGNLCRCTGYRQIVEAIALAAERLKAAA